MKAIPVTVGAGVLVLAGCGDGGGAAEGITVRDSAGVEIVENAASAYDSPPTWTLGEPVLRIGRVEGDAEYLFDGIAGAVRLEDGRIVVANSGSSTLRWYSPDGTFLFERGGQGGGPGEFERLSSFGRSRGDTLHVLDGSANRLVRYTADGELIATTPLEGTARPPGPVHALADGSYITGVGGFSTATLGDEIETGVQRYREPVVRFFIDASPTDTLGMFPGTEIEVLPRGEGFLFGPARFGKTLEYAAAGDVVYIGTGDRFEIGVYSPDGTLLRSIRVPDIDLRLTQDVIDDYKQSIRARAVENGSDGPDLEQTLAAMTFPESVPAYTALLVDDENNLWVERHASDTSAPRTWSVFDEEGRFVGSVEMPARFRPFHIARGEVIGRALDELDVQTVVVYPIEKEQE